MYMSALCVHCPGGPKRVRSPITVVNRKLEPRKRLDQQGLLKQPLKVILLRVNIFILAKEMCLQIKISNLVSIIVSLNCDVDGHVHLLTLLLLQFKTRELSPLVL